MTDDDAKGYEILSFTLRVQTAGARQLAGRPLGQVMSLLDSISRRCENAQNNDCEAKRIGLHMDEGSVILMASHWKMTRDGMQFVLDKGVDRIESRQPLLL